MQSFLIKHKNRKSFLEVISSLKYSTRENYKAALNRFDQYCDQKYSRNVQEVIQELKLLEFEQRDDAYLVMLQDYINWLNNLPLANTTINLYFQIITYYFSYHGIRSQQFDLRRNIKKPKKIKEKLHVLTKDEIQQILMNANEKRKTLYLTLIGSGMRIQECVSLRKHNFDLSFQKRIKIEIPAKYTKSQASHTTFVSKYASKYLKPVLKSINDEDLVFATNPNPFHAKMTEIEAFSRLREKIGFTEKYESSNRHHISLHSFRSYFFTRARRAHDTDIAHAMVGHTTYLDMYDRKDDQEKLELFLKVELLL